MITKRKETLVSFALFCHSLFCEESCVLKFDLIGDSVHCDVSIFVVWNAIFFPFLTELFSNNLFEDFAPIIFAILEAIFEILFRTNRFCIERHKQKFLFGSRFELDCDSLIMSCLIQHCDLIQNVGSCNREVNRFLKNVSEHIVVSERILIVELYHFVSHYFVFHLCVSFPFPFCIYIIHPKPGLVNTFFKKIFLFFPLTTARECGTICSGALVGLCETFNNLHRPASLIFSQTSSHNLHNCFIFVSQRFAIIQLSRGTESEHERVVLAQTTDEWGLK